MPKFSKRSKERLATCHPDLQKIFNEVIKHVDCTILEGERDKETQDEYYRTGKSQLRYPQSKHNSIPSKAVDVVPYYSDKPHIRWSDTVGFAHFAGFVLGIASQMNIKLRWGGNFDRDDEIGDDSFFDAPHYELDD